MKPLLLAALLCLISTAAICDDNLASLTIRDHKFAPAEIHVKAHTPTTVTLTNEDDQAEEFDSTALKIEKVVTGHATGIMRLRPLAPGRYPFMGEFHSETAQGVVVAE
ncbi:MAG TPA: cupredoxin domain-containing protein [Rhizomicrobium sp.]|nr:cupredoxin domain-containing protein [Rhizomicrobium sp.]